MFRYFIIFILSLTLNSKFVFGLENKILLKIDSEIITTIDIANEISYLQALNKEIKTLDEKPFLYGKEDYRNPSLLIKRAENLND